MLVFGNKAICYNSTAIDWTDINDWKKISPSFIKSQTYNPITDYNVLSANAGGFIIHIKNSSDVSGIGTTLDYYYNNSVPICYYSASNTPFVEPTDLMKPKYVKPDGLTICKSQKHTQEESILSTEGWNYSIKFIPESSAGKNAGYYVFDDSYLRNNNIPYLVEFTTECPYRYSSATYIYGLPSQGSGCAIWMGKVPTPYNKYDAYAALNRCTFSSINNLEITVSGVGKKYTESEIQYDNIPIFAPGDVNQYTPYNFSGRISYIKQLNNVKINQIGSYPRAIILANNCSYDLQASRTNTTHIDKCISVSSNNPVYCYSIGTATDCTNLIQG